MKSLRHWKAKRIDSVDCLAYKIQINDEGTQISVGCIDFGTATLKKLIEFINFPIIKKKTLYLDYGVSSKGVGGNVLVPCAKDYGDYKLKVSRRWAAVKIRVFRRSFIVQNHWCLEEKLLIKNSDLRELWYCCKD